MKYALFSLILMFFLGFLACAGDKSQALLDAMKTALEESETNLPDLEPVRKRLADLEMLLAKAPEELKSDAELGPVFSEISDKIGSLAMRLGALESQHSDLTKKLESLLEDYSNAKIKTDAAKPEFETIANGLREATDGLVKMTENSDAVSADYAKMMASWNAKKEE